MLDDLARTLYEQYRTETMSKAQKSWERAKAREDLMLTAYSRATEIPGYDDLSPYQQEIWRTKAFLQDIQLELPNLP